MSRLDILQGNGYGLSAKATPQAIVYSAVAFSLCFTNAATAIVDAAIAKTAKGVPSWELWDKRRRSCRGL